MKRTLFILLAVLCIACCTPSFDVIVVGGGASGSCAAIQAARSGARTMVLEEGPWLGGMLTSAGVSAVDGNFKLRAGLFGEFCDSLARRYGSLENLHTGWVSRIMFEPQIGAEVLLNMARREKNLTLVFSGRIRELRSLRSGWELRLEDGSRVRTRILVDGTELGDVAAACGVPCDKGNEDGVIQDLTMVLIVRDYGHGEDRTIPKPEGYDPALYANCCINPLNRPSAKGQMLWTPEQMLSYGRLPGGDIMLNWPIEGNDCYADMIDASPERRKALRDSAAAISLGYLYFIQTELGYKSLGIAEGVFPTEDGLPLMPYHRESRRIHGIRRFTLADAVDPYSSELYSEGVAPGDYPVDHHHFRHPDWESLPREWPRIWPFSVPLGVMIPRDVDGLIVAEKSVSVDFAINGATRLQPVVMELGQAAGILAAICARENLSPRDVPVIRVQRELLRLGARIQPYLDANPGDEAFAEMQLAGSLGLVRAQSFSSGWTNCSRLSISPEEAVRLCREAGIPSVNQSK